MDCRTFSKTVIAGIGGLLLLSAAGTVKAAPPNSTNGISSSEPLAAQPEATPAAPFNSVNLKRRRDDRRVSHRSLRRFYLQCFRRRLCVYDFQWHPDRHGIRQGDRHNGDHGK